MAAPPGNGMSIFDQQKAEDKNKWDNLVCEGKDRDLTSIRDIDQWVITVGTCVQAADWGGSVPTNNDKIEEDDPKRTISDSFGDLSGGRSMTALGDNNDCLIHSFLTCISSNFRILDHEVRSIVASHFRRFVLPSIIKNKYAPTDDIIKYVVPRLESYNFLTGAEIDFLSDYFKIPIINIRDSSLALERRMEIFPSNPNSFLKKNTGNDNRLSFYIIHGTNVHFTPVKYGNEYAKEMNYGIVKQLSEKITEEHDAAFEKASTNAAKKLEKIEIIQEDFKGIIKDDMESIKKQQQIVNNERLMNSKERSLKKSALLEILKFQVDKYLKDNNEQITKLGLNENETRTAIHRTLLEELNKNLAPPASTPSGTLSLEQLKKFEEITGQAGMDNSFALSKAMELSMPELAIASPSLTHTVSINSGVHRNQVVLRTLSGITATVGENSGKYTAIVYEPVKRGGKRNTKKAMRVKKQKTKKLKRSK
jgi:hypothetical protein